MNPLKQVVDGSEETEDGPVNASMEDEEEEGVKRVAEQDETLASSSEHLQMHDAGIKSQELMSIEETEATHF